MQRASRAMVILDLLLGVVVAGCSSAVQTTSTVGVGAPTSMSSAQASAASGRRAPNEADVHFVSGMIPHHAQAVLIAGWAPTHGASQDVRLMCERIVVGQTDEIKLMQTWLRDRGLPVPSANATHMKMVMNGMEHDMLMPGMLDESELKALDAARGAAFDRLFLAAMIKHHEGAITMVNELNASPGAAQDEFVFRFSSDVFADQTTEIERMNKMLNARLASPPT